MLSNSIAIVFETPDTRLFRKNVYGIRVLLIMRSNYDRTGCRSDRTGDTHTLCITTHTPQDGLLIWTHERHWTTPVKVESRFFLMFLDGGKQFKGLSKILIYPPHLETLKYTCLDWCCTLVVVFKLIILNSKLNSVIVCGIL
jgi:hypothetical protein